MSTSAVDQKPVPPSTPTFKPPASPAPAGATTPNGGADAPLEITPGLEKSPTAELRAQINKHLKANAQRYWKLLKNYLSSRLSKSEFDSEMKGVLNTPQLLALHNLFLLSILKTTYAAFAPKKSARMHSRSLMPRPAPYRRRQAMEPSHFARENAETAALHKRMMKVANASGIVSIQPDVVQLMLNALERHMIRVISGVQPDVTRQPEAYSDFGDEDHDVVMTSIPGDISGRDIVRAVQRRPHILGESNHAGLMLRLSVKEFE